MKTKTRPNVRKASWTCLDLAFKVQTETHAQKLVLLYLAKSVNDSLSCYPSYAAIKRHTGVTGDSTISEVLKYLRDTLKVLKWRRGSAKRREANRYMFDIAHMNTAVVNQLKQATPATGEGATPTVRVDAGDTTTPATGEGATPASGGTTPIVDGTTPAAGDQASVKQHSTKQLSKEELSTVQGGTRVSQLPSEEDLDLFEQIRRRL